MVYAYYDTYTHEYVILEATQQNVLAYGYLTSPTELTVEGYSGGSNINTETIEFENPLDLEVPTLEQIGNGCYPYAVIARMDTTV
jgi:hypothetical protein